MVLEVTIENVGGLKGVHQYRFKQGNLNIIEGDNANGKSSIVKGLIAVLSVPNNFDIIKNEEEAQKLGIISEERNPRTGFVNIHNTYAKVELQGDGLKDSYEITRDSKAKKLPLEGDLNFLYAGALTKDSRIFRDLREGINDFGWIVSKLSSAKYYDSAKKTIDEKITESSDTLFKLQEKTKLLLDLKKEKEKLEQKLSILTAERSKITESSEKYDERFKKRDELAKQKEEYQDRVNKYVSAIEQLTKQVSEIESKQLNLEKETEKLHLSLKEIGRELRLDRSERINEIDKKITNLIEQRGAIDAKINIYLPSKQALEKSNKQEDICPVCETGKITKKKIKTQLDAFYIEKDSINKKIAALSTEKNKYKERVEELKAQQEEKVNELSEKEGELEKLKRGVNLSDLKSRKDGFVRDLETTKNKVKNSEQELNKIDAELKGINKNSVDRLAKYDQDIGGCNKRLSQIEEVFIGSSLNINGEQVDVDRALRIYGSWLSALSEIQNRLKDKADIQRQKARVQFNENIGKMMDILNFTDLRNIKLNNENKLFVERIDEKTKQLLMQDVKTLATSEKLTIAILLQIALKETYLQSIPFLILDDIEDFDESRRKKIFNYLSDKAKKNGWYVIATKLVESRKGLMVKQFEQGA